MISNQLNLLKGARMQSWFYYIFTNCARVIFGPFICKKKKKLKLLQTYPAESIFEKREDE